MRAKPPYLPGRIYSWIDRPVEIPSHNHPQILGTTPEMRCRSNLRSRFFGLGLNHTMENYHIRFAYKDVLTDGLWLVLSGVVTSDTAQKENCWNLLTNYNEEPWIGRLVL